MCGAHRATAPTTNSSRSDAGAQCHHNATSPPSTTDCWKTRDGDGTLTHGAPQRRDVGTRNMPARPDWPPGGYRPALRGTCPDADDASVEAAEATVSNLKASEFKPGRRHAHHGRILAPGGRRMEPARVAVAGETRRCLGVRDPRCRPDSRGSRTRANYRTVAMGIAFRTSMIVPAPNPGPRRQVARGAGRCAIARRGSPAPGE